MPLTNSQNTRTVWLIALAMVGIVVIGPASHARAEGESAPAPNLSASFDVFTKESIVEINGKKFRKVEYKSKSVYLQLLADDSTSSSDVQVMCEENGGANPLAPQQVVVAVKVTKRTSLFVDGLRKVCQDVGRGKRVTIDPAIQIGFMIDDGDPKALLKNKKVFISPFGGRLLNFSAEW